MGSGASKKPDPVPVSSIGSSVSAPSEPEPVGNSQFEVHKCNINKNKPFEQDGRWIDVLA